MDDSSTVDSLNGDSLKGDSGVRLSEVLTHLIKVCDRGSMTLGEFLHELNVYGHMLVCLIFATPFFLPIPLPGLSTIFGFVICLAASQIALGVEPWVPLSWREKKISVEMVRRAFEIMRKMLVHTEKLIRPRLKFFARHPGFVRVNGIVIFLVGLLLSLPMPPGFNAPPALAIVVLAVGSLERDGVVVITGYILSILNMCLFGAIFFLGYEGVRSAIGL